MTHFARPPHLLSRLLDITFQPEQHKGETTMRISLTSLSVARGTVLLAGLFAIVAPSPVRSQDTDEKVTEYRAGKNFIATEVYSLEQDQQVLRLFEGLRVADVSDGMGHVYLAGEKYVPADEYYAPRWCGDLHGWNTGYGYDMYRSTASPPRPDTPGFRQHHAMRPWIVSGAGIEFAWTGSLARVWCRTCTVERRKLVKWHFWTWRRTLRVRPSESCVVSRNSFTSATGWVASMWGSRSA